MKAARVSTTRKISNANFQGILFLVALVLLSSCQKPKVYDTDAWQVCSGTIKRGPKVSLEGLVVFAVEQSVIYPAIGAPDNIFAKSASPIWLDIAHVDSRTISQKFGNSIFQDEQISAIARVEGHIISSENGCGNRRLYPKAMIAESIVLIQPDQK